VRDEREWPLARTRWTKYFLDATQSRLVLQPVSQEASATFSAMTTAVEFSTTLEEDTEVTGPVAARLLISSSTTDADLFLTIQIFDAESKEVTFVGASEPAAPVAQGWLRASHRALDLQRTQPYRPWDSHQSIDKLEPGKVYPVDVEMWPTSMVFPKGYRLVLGIEGKDFERAEATVASTIGRSAMVVRGSGPFLHTDPGDRPIPEFAGQTTIFTGQAHPSFLMLPIIPSKTP
jgi:uncharacterized protein